jgi:hypothetical protein
VSEKASEGILLTEVGGIPSALSICLLRVERILSFLSASISRPNAETHIPSDQIVVTTYSYSSSGSLANTKSSKVVKRRSFCTILIPDS